MIGRVPFQRKAKIIRKANKKKARKRKKKRTVWLWNWSRSRFELSEGGGEIQKKGSEQIADPRKEETKKGKEPKKKLVEKRGGKKILSVGEEFTVKNKRK